MVRGDEARLSAAKRAYRSAAAEGNHQEEARWANVVGDILKNRGEYVEALKWLRIDYEVSRKFLPQKQLLATCQSLGEVYLRLEFFSDALIYQKKHLELAKDSNDFIEQQRASTQIGRTYHEMFLRSDDDHYSVRNAKKYFRLAMNLAKTLKENPPIGSSSFLKEYIDAYNNIGMLEIDLDNLEEAENILKEGLRICDEEEVVDDDDGRTRLHHNLGKVYLELRKWDDARFHIEKDIVICNRIGHCQGEAKGYINLGELHYRVQKCEEAISCYEKALNLAKSMEDEDALAEQICQNIVTVKEALKVSDELKKEEQHLKKLIRNMPKERGTARERKCLLQQNSCLDRLIEKSSMISAWLKHRCYAKEKKRVASELCDKEKLGDSFLVIGESYQKLRNFSEALQWYKKSWETHKSIGNLEGQALAKINMGDALDSDGDWEGALNTFEEGYQIALQANLPSVQLSALENMHYSHMIRFDNVEEARRLQLLIDKLKRSMTREHEAHKLKQDCCSETDTEGDDLPTNVSDMSCSNRTTYSDIGKRQSQTQDDDREDAPLISLRHAKKNRAKLKCPHSPLNCREQTEDLPKNTTSSQQELAGRKRIRVIISDDEEGEAHEEVRSSKGKHHEARREDVATSDESKSWDNRAGKYQDVSLVASRRDTHTCSPMNIEESICSYPEVGIRDSKNPQTSSIGEAINNHLLNEEGRKPHAATSGSISNDFSSLNKHACSGQCGEYHLYSLEYKPTWYMNCHQRVRKKLYTFKKSVLKHMLIKIEENFVHVDLSSFMVGDKVSVECMKAEVACLYYLQLPEEKRSQGLLPIIQLMRCGGRSLDGYEDVDNLKDHLCGKGWVDVSISGWVQKHLMKLYIHCCKELSESPNLKLLKKLYNLQVSEDEVVVSDCELLDVSIIPLLNALEIHRTVAVLDLSHNSLGNGTVEKLQKVLTSGQRYGGLVLDLHQNLLGPSSLFQICECPVLFSRLEVLNISGNRLTDACGYCLSSILENCKALYSLSIERCSITSRTIQKIVDALHSDSALSHISIGYNSPVSSSTIINLLEKLATLKRFSELNLSGLKLGKPVVNSLCQLTKTLSFSALMLGDTNLGTEGALQLGQALNSSEELVKLDLSSCGVTSEYVASLNTNISMISSLVELNLGGNPIMQEGGNAMASFLKNPQCSLRVLVLSKCQLGLSGVIHILQALAENSSLEELNLAENSSKEIYPMPPCDTSPMIPEEVNAPKPEPLAAKIDCDNLEVADSEDDTVMVGPGDSDRADGCVSSSQRNISTQESPLVRELSNAIGLAEHLRFLDLSDNELTNEIADVLYATWSSCSRANLAQRHIQKKFVHFSVQGYKCCRVKPCCRKD